MIKHGILPLVVGMGVLIVGGVLWKLATIFPNAAGVVFVTLIFLVLAWLIGALILGGMMDTNDSNDRM